MTVLSKLPTKIPVNERSIIELVLEAANSEDPLLRLQNLKDSLKIKQKDGEEATFGQIQEHMELEKWIDSRRTSVEKLHKYYKSEKCVLFTTIAASASGCFILGVIFYLLYNLYLEQELSEIAKFALSGPMMLMGLCILGMAYLRNDVCGNPLKVELRNSMKVSELQKTATGTHRLLSK